MSMTPAKTLIVGVNGRMGKMLAQKAQEAGLPFAGLQRPYEKANLDELTKDVDLVLVSVPAKHFAGVLKQLTPHLPENAILSDVISVKETPMRQMEAAWAGQIVGTHPLFGPKNKPGDDLPVAITPGKNATTESIAKTAAFFTAIGCRVFETTPEKHDKAVARIQNLNFITTLAYFAALAHQEELLPFLTPSFERRKIAAAKMLTEDAEMFAGLFEANPHSLEAVRQYRRFLNLAAAGDVELLSERARWWWPKDDEKSKE